MNIHKVLVVADNAFHLGLMADLLEANGLRTYRANSATEAVQSVDSIRPDLVVVDMALPREGARDVLDRLKGRPATSGVPVVAVADRNQQTEAQKVLDHAFTACVDKPIDTMGFSRSVLTALRRHAAASV